MARMNILLTKDVEEVGLAGEVHAVASGYARNFLMPRGFAILATKGALKQAEEIRQIGIHRRAQEKADAEAQSGIIEGQKLIFEAKAGENDRLYGSVTTSEIADRLSSMAGFEINRRKIQLLQPLRELGIYPMSVKLVPDVVPNFEVAVVREGEDWAAAEARKAAADAEIAAKAAIEAERKAAAAKAEREMLKAAEEADAAAAAEAESTEGEATEAETSDAETPKATAENDSAE